MNERKCPKCGSGDYDNYFDIYAPTGEAVLTCNKCGTEYISYFLTAEQWEEFVKKLKKITFAGEDITPDFELLNKCVVILRDKLHSAELIVNAGSYLSLFGTYYAEKYMHNDNIFDLRYKKNIIANEELL